MQAGTGVGAQPDYIAGIGRDFRFNQNDMKQGRLRGVAHCGAVRAKTMLVTLDAPERFSVAAISSRVAPVVMTSSTTPTWQPSNDAAVLGVRTKAWLTFALRSAAGSCVCAVVLRI